MQDFILILKWGLLAICLLILLFLIFDTYFLKKRVRQLKEKIADIENERDFAQTKLLALLDDLGFSHKILSYRAIKEDTFLVTLPPCVADEFIQKLEELKRMNLKAKFVPIYEIISDCHTFNSFYDIENGGKTIKVREIQFREIDYSISITYTQKDTK